MCNRALVLQIDVHAVLLELKHLGELKADRVAPARDSL